MINLIPNAMNITRVIALPVETVEKRDGTVNVEGKRLDTFYGSTLSLGMGQDESPTYLDEQNATYDEERFREYFSRDIDEIELSDNEVFVLGDNG
ncbi:S26 family signal peptidase [Sutcliffiella horikoshii]|uniref:S26 family signal peptidase n=1 Tax=Sutcliffiella horikoshii TaxID=79883 RepID=UPI003850D240